LREGDIFLILARLSNESSSFSNYFLFDIQFVYFKNLVRKEIERSLIDHLSRNVR
jgi:hypothetical protein